MNRREFLHKSVTVAVAVTGLTLAANLGQSVPARAETSVSLNLETWLLTTGQDELPADVYALAVQKLSGEPRIYMPMVQR